MGTRKPRARLGPPQGAGGFQTVHLGHLDVHQDEVEALVGGLLGHRRQRQAAVLHGHGLMASALQDAGDDPAVDGVVLRHQDAQGAAPRPGTLLPSSQGLPAPALPTRAWMVSSRCEAITGLATWAWAPSTASRPGSGAFPPPDSSTTPAAGSHSSRRRPASTRKLVPGKAGIQQQQAEGIAGLAGRLGGLQRPLGVTGDHPHLPAGQQATDHLALAGVIVDQQHRQAGQLRPAAGRLPAAGSRSNRAVKMNRLPRPSSLSTRIWPCISSTSWAQIASPRPVPPKRRVVESSACTNDSNTALRRSAGMPMPVSATSTCSVACSAPRLEQRHLHRHLAAIGELHGVADQVGDHLLQPFGIADQAGRAPGGRRPGSAPAPCRGPGRPGPAARRRCCRGGGTGPAPAAACRRRSSRNPARR